MIRSKYGSKKVVYDEITFDSKMELCFYKLLKERNIDFVRQQKFILQPKFKINGKAVREISYICDFVCGDDVIDVKGFETTDFKIKKKLFAYKYQKEIILLKNKKQMIEYISRKYLNNN